MRNYRRALVTVTTLLLLAAILLLAGSCGRAGKTDTTPSDQAPGSGDVTVDDYIKQMDTQMDSVDLDDFSNGQLSDQELGL